MDEEGNEVKKPKVKKEKKRCVVLSLVKLKLDLYKASHTQQS